ncbi:uncharacterized protein DDB_G0286299 isoform X2 [Nilaparvata lugens]|nr:uncharacterized protein DDB_G0286299 isoform X2 [Nilaparvata lugens]
MTRRRNDKKSKGRETVKISKRGRVLNIGYDDPNEIYGKHSNAFCVAVLDENKFTRFRRIKPLIKDVEGKDYTKQFTLKHSTLWRCLDRNTAYGFFILDRVFRGTIELKRVHVARSTIKAWHAQLNPKDVDTHTKYTAQFNEKLVLSEKRDRIRYIGKIERHRPNSRRWAVAKRDHRSQSGSETDDEEEKPPKKGRKKVDSDQEEEDDREKGRKEPDGRRKGKKQRKSDHEESESEEEEEEEEEEQPPRRRRNKIKH